MQIIPIFSPQRTQFRPKKKVAECKLEMSVKMKTSNVAFSGFPEHLLPQPAAAILESEGISGCLGCVLSGF